MMNAAAGIFLAANRKPTAKSYVQDGLVAMWDGIENAGYGVHDAAATTWTDLSGNGYDAKIIRLLPYAYWEDNGFRYNKTSPNGDEYYFHVKSTTDIQMRLGNTFTIGFTAKVSPGNNRKYTGFIGDSGDYVKGFFIESNAKKGAYYVATGVRSVSEEYEILNGLPLSNASPFDLSISVVSDFGNASVYANAVLIDSGFTMAALARQGFAIGASYDYNNLGYNPYPRNYYRTSLATFNRVWIYDRALSASEVAAEFSIDKARFGLA